jgi:hypothetical protein
MEWPQGVSADEFKAKAAKVGGAAEQVKPEGFMRSFAEGMGVDPSAKPSLKDLAIDSVAGPAAAVPGALKSLYEGGKRSVEELKQARDAGTEGNQAAQAQHLITAIPFIGPALDKGSDQYADKNYAGEAGTLLAGAAQAAPLAEGAIDGGLTDMVPSRARAGDAFESLNRDLAQHPVPLNATLKPLQRITEIGERSSNLPAPVLKFLQRAQMTEPMTFPEARDYQGGLSDLSSADLQSMPKRVKGALSQLNKGLFQDMQDSAEAAGRGDEYAKAMKEYRQASTLKDIATKSGKTLGKAALTGAGLGLGYNVLKDIQASR